MYNTFTQPNIPTQDLPSWLFHEGTPEMELQYIFLVLTAPVKEFKAVNNSISRVIWVMIAKPEDFV